MEPGWHDCYRRHFARFLGKPFDVEAYESRDGLRLQLATHDRYPHLRVYASLGLAAEVSRDIGEVVLVANDFSPDVPFLFVNALFFILHRDLPLGSGFAVGGVDLLCPDFAEEHRKVALYFTTLDDVVPEFARLHCEGEVGRVFQAVFISESQLDLLNRFGPADLEKVLRERWHEDSGAEEDSAAEKDSAAEDTAAEDRDRAAEAFARFLYARAGPRRIVRDA